MRHTAAVTSAVALVAGAAIGFAAAGADDEKVVTVDRSARTGPAAVSTTPPTASPAVAPPAAATRPAQALRGIDVAVFNETTEPGRARTIANLVGTFGAGTGVIRNGTTQQRERSVVVHAPGQAPAARRVQSVLGLTGVRPATQAELGLADGAEVIVLVGRIRAETVPAPPVPPITTPVVPTAPGPGTRTALRAVLVAPRGGKATGTALILRSAGATGLSVRARGLAPASDKVALGVWLRRGPRKRFLGYLQQQVGADGRLVARAGLSQTILSGTTLLITRERERTPRAPGRAVLRGTLREP